MPAKARTAGGGCLQRSRPAQNVQQPLGKRLPPDVYRGGNDDAANLGVKAAPLEHGSRSPHIGDASVCAGADDRLIYAYIGKRIGARGIFGQRGTGNGEGDAAEIYFHRALIYGIGIGPKDGSGFAP